MKKILTAIITIAIISTMLVSFGAAALPEEWITTSPDAFTVNTDGSVTVSATANVAAYLNKEITGDFTLEFQVNTPQATATTDQKAVVAVMCPTDWTSGGYWIRFCDKTGEDPQLNDATDPTYAGPASQTAVTLTAVNNVKIERVGNELTFTVNGVEVAKDTPEVTTGKFISIGLNMYATDLSELTSTAIFKNIKLTVGSETFNYFTIGTDTSDTSNTDTADSTVFFAGIAMLSALIGFVIVFKAKKA